VRVLVLAVLLLAVSPDGRVFVNLSAAQGTRPQHRTPLSDSAFHREPTLHQVILSHADIVGQLV
jgi:hypothetical protein